MMNVMSVKADLGEFYEQGENLHQCVKAIYHIPGRWPR